MEAKVRQPRESSRDRRSRETRQALLDAAYALFCEHGYAGTSLDRIAEQAGYTKGAVYPHFASKEELFLALMESKAASLTARWTDAEPDDAPKSMGEWLSQAMSERREWFLVSAEFTVLAARKPTLAERHRASITQVCDELAAQLREIGGDITESDAATLSRVVMAMMNGLVLHAAIDPGLDLAADFDFGLHRLAGIPAGPRKG
ncbi:TetR/AcrR family transcriptional regulator [Nocardia sp. NPDC056100]|uniref:TetR/AcrR family transcriptional regulator n=1 Tax=Nocardia sp. NPDC056100 TaxID=3345712 RepID=UPI0035E29C85